MEHKLREIRAEISTFGNTDLPDGTLERPLVTFALFAFNQERYIRDAVEGAFSQSYSPLEIILSDDCSSDRTFDIMKEMAEVYEGPHRIILERTYENLGSEKFGRRIWNTLLRSNGELIVIAGGDDVSLPHRSEVLFSVWDSHGRGRVCIHSRANVIDQSGNAMGSSVGTNAIANRSLTEFIYRDGYGLLGATNAVSRSLRDAFGPLADRLLIEDGALAFRARLCDGILFSEDCLVEYRRHSTNLTAPDDQMNEHQIEKYATALFAQHTAYLADYLSCCNKPDPKVLRMAVKQLRRSSVVSGLLSRKLIERLCAAKALGQRASLRRKLWLIWRALIG